MTGRCGNDPALAGKVLEAVRGLGRTKRCPVCGNAWTTFYVFPFRDRALCVNPRCWLWGPEAQGIRVADVLAITWSEAGHDSP